MTATLKRAGCELQEAESLKAAKTLILQSRPNLLVIDERVDDLGCLQAAHQLVITNALVNLAAVSELTDVDFHKTSEGLGIMARLSPTCRAQNAAGLLIWLSQMQAMASGIPSWPG